MHDALGLSQFHARIDGVNLISRHHRNCTCIAALARKGDTIGQIKFFLGIIVFKLIEQAPQLCPIEQHDATIAKLDGFLLRIGIGYFDNRFELTFAVQNKPSIRARIVWRITGDHNRGFGLGAFLLHGMQGIGCNQRPIAEQSDHIAFEIFQLIPRGFDRIAGAEGLLLDGAFMGSNRFFNRFLPGRYDRHDFLCVQIDARIEHMLDHRQVRNFMQNLRQVRFHAGALACGQNHASQRR